MERKLSRGLDALLPKTLTSEPANEGPQSIPIASIRPNPRQPRLEFATEGLDELKASIARDGLLQPIVVRRVADGFELIAGERRTRACRALGMTHIPAIVRRAEDEQQLVLALVENLQRRDLNAIEEAKGFAALLQDFGITHEEVAKRVGKERSTITNAVRLLDLPDGIQADVSRGTLSAGHARALLPLVGKPGLMAVRERIRVESLSVRATEAAVRDVLEKLAGSGGLDRDRRAGGRMASKDPALRDLEDRLRRSWNSRVSVRARGQSHSLTFHCATRAEFDRLLARLDASGGRRGGRERAQEIED